ncbi:MAG: redoxin family protein [Glaciecola sp.]|jgi:cytochrome c biogenesis protein CcmG/thiol:disulfide interchange protein DsbE
MSKPIRFVLPLVFFIVLVFFLFQGLFSDPRARDAQTLEKPMPAFSLPDLMDPSITHTPAVFEGEVTLLNVWGVWCVTCKVELPYLTSLRENGVRIVGLYYDQDLDPDFGTKTLQRVQQEVLETTTQLGNPFQFNIFDVYRNTSLDLGVTGAPETLLIDPNGIIRVHHIGDVNERVWEQKFAALYNQLMQQQGASHAMVR